MKKTLLKNILLTAGLTLVLIPKISAQNAIHEWSGQYRGITTGTSGTNSMIVRSPGVGFNIYTCGQFSGTVDFDMGTSTSSLASNGGDDIFIACQQSDGTYTWAFALGGSGNDTAWTITQGHDDQLYIGGSFSGTVDFDAGSGITNLTSAGGSDGFVLKIDFATGNFLWAANVAEGTGLASVRQVDFLSDSSIVSAGNFDNAIDTDPSIGTTTLASAGGSEVFVSVLDYAGALKHSWSFAGLGADQLYNIGINQADDILVNGYYEGSLDLIPDTATYLLAPPVNRAMFLSRTDSTGTFLSGGMLATPHKVSMGVIPASYRVVLSGAFLDSIDCDIDTLFAVPHYSQHPGTLEAFVFILSPTAMSTYDHFSYGGPGDDIPNCISIDQDDIVFGGNTTSALFDADPDPIDSFVFAGGGNDMYAIAFNVWTMDLLNSGLADNQTSSRMVNCAYTNYDWTGFAIYIAGSFTQTCDFNPTVAVTTMTSSGITTPDAFQLKWAPCATQLVGLTFAACDTFFVYNNITYPVPCQFNDTLQSVCGADSILLFNVYLFVSDTTVTNNGNTLISGQSSGCNYQWLDCNNGYAPINGANSQSFTPAGPGSYACCVSNGNCADTSGCHTITGINEIHLTDISVSPNPFNSNLTVSGLQTGSMITMYNVLGEAVLQLKTSGATQIIDTEFLTPGTYLLVTENQGIKNTTRVVK